MEKIEKYLNDKTYEALEESNAFRSKGQQPPEKLLEAEDEWILELAEYYHKRGVLPMQKYFPRTPKMILGICQVKREAGEKLSQAELKEEREAFLKVRAG